ncbi:MAG: class I SAM-dependent methyltransferase [Myxococcota bacterium]|nr:class I SAM-dependent methyltransferase [Myxococcota bacterium]
MTRHPYPAELYELVHRGTAGDIAFYQRVCEDARGVLELGCGYGRVLEGLAGLGIALTGLEIDPHLLERASARLRDAPKVRLVQADMCAFDGPSTFAPGAGFDRILIPYSGIYCLPDDASCVECFRCCAEQLAPGGRLVFDAYAADAFHRDENPADHIDERLEPVVSVEFEGRRFDVFERSRWERPCQQLDVTYEYVPHQGGEALQGRLLHRYLLRNQIAPLLEQAGLQLQSLHGDWQGHPTSSESEMWVATALRAESE